MTLAPAAETEIDALLAANYPPEGPGAAVILTQNGRPLYRRAYGMANLELGVRMAPEMVFRLGSVTKQFTAAAVLLLVEQGALRLEDPITRYLPGFPNQGHTIRVEHLLTHTSGIKNYTTLPELRFNPTRDVSLRQLIELLQPQPLEFAPGTRWAFSNSGYVLLGAIIEQVSGLPYETFMQQRIYNPLGLRRTYASPGLRIIPQRVAGYDRDPQGWLNAPYISSALPSAAGVMASCVDDLARWDAALSAGQLLKPETLQRAFTPYRLQDGAPTRYGYGWVIHNIEGRAWQEHSGSTPGFVCYVARIPSEGLFLALLSNTTGAERLPEELGIRILTQVLGRPYRDPDPLDLPADALSAIAGTYHTPSGQERQIVYEDGILCASDWEPGRCMELTPVTPDELIPGKLSLHRLCLQRSPGGQITGFTWQNPYGEIDETFRRL